MHAACDGVALRLDQSLGFRLPVARAHPGVLGRQELIGEVSPGTGSSPSVTHQWHLPAVWLEVGEQ